MSKAVRVGGLTIGGGNPVVIQSMTNIKTANFDELKNQIDELYLAGCPLVRMAINSMTDIEAARRLIIQTKAVLVADIQLNYRLAIAASDVGFKKLRINPGNIGSEEKIQQVVAACKSNGTVIRVGSNSGSINKEAYDEWGNSAKALAQSVLKNVHTIERLGFFDIIISAKASSVPVMIEANRILARQTSYPLHLGVTESGTKTSGVIKSSIGIGALLCDGIGDTIRVSLSAEPIEEVKAAKQILRAVGLDKGFCEIISCPTCARCNYNLTEIAQWLEDYTADIKTPLKIAVMGCVVNGPGEAREADFGVAGGDGKAAVFCKGKVTKTIPLEDIKQEFINILRPYK